MLHGTAMAHCPTSNFFFAKEALPVRQLLQVAHAYYVSYFYGARTHLLLFSSCLAWPFHLLVIRCVIGEVFSCNDVSNEL